MKNKLSIVGILNITPDSYHDGGQYLQLPAALSRAEEMLAEGADIIDIGGESTFIDRDEVSESEEIKRTIPVIKAIKKNHPEIIISIDTSKAAVAQAAIEAGATMVNDVTAGRGDSGMFPLMAKHQSVSLVLMYAKDATSRTTTGQVDYDDVVQTIINFLEKRIALVKAAGVNQKQIIIDPGLGFFISADADYSLEIIARLGEFQKLGYPIYLSPSRKSFLAGQEKLPPAQRLPGTIAASAIAVLKGATYIRTHDVQAVRRGCEIAQKIKSLKDD
jgi:dihydropteroate synthase